MTWARSATLPTVGALCAMALAGSILTATPPVAAATHPALIAYADASRGVLVVEPGHPRTQMRIAGTAGAESPSWSPNGKRLAFVVPGSPNSATIQTVDRDGTRPRRLLAGSSAGADGAIAWSPNGEDIAYACHGADTSAGYLDQLCLLVLRTGKHSQITSASSSDGLSQTAMGFQRLSWSPDGTKVAATVDHPIACDPSAPAGSSCHSSDVGLITVRSGSYHLLTNNYALEPSFSPDGTHLVYYDPSATGGEPTGVVVMDADGSHARSVVSEATVRGGLEDVDADPIYSPSGTRILYAGAAAGNGQTAAQLFAVPAAGGRAVQWTQNAQDAFDLSWTSQLRTCTVPQLIGKRLAKAKRLLTKAACRLGKVKGPKHHRGRLHIVKERPKAHRELASDSKVDVTLG